jgi:hypothetical protein
VFSLLIVMKSKRKPALDQIICHGTLGYASVLTSN